MKKTTYLFALALGTSTLTYAQNVGINTDGSDPDANTILHINNHSGSSLDSALLRIENEKSTSGTGVQIHNSGQATTTAQWDIIVPGSSTDLRIKGNGSDHITIQNDGDVGIRTNSPVSGLDIQTSMGLAVLNHTDGTDITLDNTHNVVLCNNGPYTVTLPAAGSNTGKIYYLKNIDTDGDDITIDGNGAETIDDVLEYTLETYKQAIRIISDGTSWHILEESGLSLRVVTNPCGDTLYLGNGTYTIVTTANPAEYCNCDGTPFEWNDVTNPETGLTWMDRNLGAQRVALSSTDDKAYGDLYQWGRAADGHQCRTSSTTATNASDETPGHALFITEDSAPFDWLTTQDDSLWQGVNGTNNPCPSGYRLPTEAEWVAERGTWISGDRSGAFLSPLKLPHTGLRSGTSGVIGFLGNGVYWSSIFAGTGARHMSFDTTFGIFSWPRATGEAIRCIKN